MSFLLSISPNVPSRHTLGYVPHVTDCVFPVDTIKSVFACVCVCVYMMNNNSNDVIAPTAQAAMPAVNFPSLCSEAALPSPSPFLVIGFSCSSSSTSSSNV